MIDFLEISAEKFKKLYPDKKLPVGVEIVRIPHFAPKCIGCIHNHRCPRPHEVEICVKCIITQKGTSK